MAINAHWWVDQLDIFIINFGLYVGKVQCMLHRKDMNYILSKHVQEWITWTYVPVITQFSELIVCLGANTVITIIIYCRAFRTPFSYGWFHRQN